MSHEIERETLMRYLDEELPPEERERVEEHLSGCTECRREVEMFRRMKRDLAELPGRPDPSRRGGRRESSVWDAVSRRLARPLGWLLLVAGVVLWGGWAAWVFVTSDAAAFEKLFTGALVIGLALLLVSVGWERYREWQHDPYRDVEK